MISHIWSHGTNSLEKLKAAVANAEITAIECDIMLGTMISTPESDCRKLGCSTIIKREPILSHPPHRESDLTVATFFELVTSKDGGDCHRTLQKNIKLDFKEVEALQPTFDLFVLCNIVNQLKKTVTLNADILPGPGRRENSNPVPPSTFFSSCLEFIKKFEKSNMIFSLSIGYQCSWSSGCPYVEEDVSAMANLLRQHKLADSGAGLVLALNARLLSLDPGVFDRLLREFQLSGILAWTGSGEPPIPKAVVDTLDAYFAGEGMKNRISFDCDIETGI